MQSLHAMFLTKRERHNMFVGVRGGTPSLTSPQQHWAPPHLELFNLTALEDWPGLFGGMGSLKKLEQDETLDEEVPPEGCVP